MGKVALVTGSSSGIGLETVLALARDGYETLAEENWEWVVCEVMSDIVSESKKAS